MTVVTVKQAARAVGRSVRQVQRDIEKGCPGIIQLGEHGKRSALLDLETYRRWRAGQSDEARAVRVAYEVGLTVVRGYQTPTFQRYAAHVVLDLLELLEARLGAELDERPPESDEICRFGLASKQHRR